MLVLVSRAIASTISYNEYSGGLLVRHQRPLCRCNRMDSICTSLSITKSSRNGLMDQCMTLQTAPRHDSCQCMSFACMKKEKARSFAYLGRIYPSASAYDTSPIFTQVPTVLLLPSCVFILYLLRNRWYCSRIICLQHSTSYFRR